MTSFSFQYIEELKKVLEDFPHDQFEKLMDLLLESYEKGKHIFVMGNGGSASTASHLACDVNKGCSLDRDKKFRMICLNDSISTMLAYANDLSYEQIFVEQLRNFFDPGDVVIGISGSGNSANVLKAIEYANNNGGITVGLCGFSGGELYRIAQIPLLVRVDDMHMIIAHMAMQQIMRRLDAAPDESASKTL
jgi:D-sedoheptulose 7-phosphate isomerase